MEKDFYIETLENMINDYLDATPNATWDEAYSLLSNKAYDATLDRYAEMIDYYKAIQGE